MGTREEVLSANEAFYRAFADADADRMRAIWASDGDDLSVIHPGAVAIAGRDGVLASWQSIFNGESRVDICCVNADARIHGDVAIVLCTEYVHGHGLAATNVFRLTADGWRLVHHHAGPCQVPQRETSSRPVLH